MENTPVFNLNNIKPDDCNWIKRQYQFNIALDMYKFKPLSEAFYLLIFFLTAFLNRIYWHSCLLMRSSNFYDC